MYFVYILKNKSGKRYIGMTSNLEVRLLAHQNDNVDSTRGSDYKKVWHCVFEDKKRAREFEKYLKSSSGYAFSNKRLL